MRRSAIVNAVLASGVLGLTALDTAGYIFGGDALRAWCGVIAVIALPIASGLALVRRCLASKVEVCLAVTLMVWATFEALIGLSAWALGVKLTSAVAFVPNIVALVLAAMTAAVGRRRVSTPGVRDGEDRKRRISTVATIATGVAIVALISAAVLSVSSEQQFYNRGQAVQLSASRRTDGAVILKVGNPTGSEQHLTLLVEKLGARFRQRRYLSCHIVAGGNRSFVIVMTLQQTLDASVYRDGRALASVRIA